MTSCQTSLKFCEISSGLARLTSYVTAAETETPQRTDFELAQKAADGDMGAFDDHLKENLKSRFNDTMALLRNKDFQDLLNNYDRAKNPFYIAYGTQATVSSAFVFKVGDQ